MGVLGQEGDLVEVVAPSWEKGRKVQPLTLVFDDAPDLGHVARFDRDAMNFGVVVNDKAQNPDLPLDVTELLRCRKQLGNTRPRKDAVEKVRREALVGVTLAETGACLRRMGYRLGWQHGIMPMGWYSPRTT